MSSSAAPSSLSRILIGSLIGAVIGLILLALGVAILWNAADQRMAGPPSSPAPTTSSAPPKPSSEATASPVPYPQVTPGSAAVPVVPEPEAPPRAATSIWRSIFDDDEERPVAAPPAPAPPPAAEPRPAGQPAPTRSASARPAPARPATPRRPPEAQRQDDSLFF